MKLTSIVAHRGDPLILIENTLRSFQSAFIKGADFIEGDFWLTKDNQIVCIHNQNTSRITKGKFKIDVTKSNLNEIKSINYLDNYHSQNFEIPTLEEVIEIIPEGKGLFLEIKDNREKFVDVLKQKIKVVQRADINLKTISYHPNILKYSKKIIPEIKTYWIFDSFFVRKNCKNKIVFHRFLQLLCELKVDGLVLNIDSNLNNFLVETLRNLNLEVCVYGVNDKSSALKMIELGVNYITTDDVGLVKETLSVYFKNLG